MTTKTDRIERRVALDGRLNEELERRARLTGHSPDEIIESALRRVLEPPRTQLREYLRMRRRFDTV